MVSDRWTIHVQALVDFNKVKDSLHVAELVMQKLSSNLVRLSIDGLLIESINSITKQDQALKVPKLQQ
jgi:hypothetical protein